MLEIENTFLAVIDIQGKLAGLVHDHEKVVTNIQYFIRACESFPLPILWSEQAPNKIGETVDSVKALLYPMIKPIHKRSFSCYGSSEYVEHLKQVNRRQILVTGIETHVCVYQTAHDLQQHGFEVFVVADATSARTQLNKEVTLARLRQENITVTCAESVICELLRTAEHPKFRDVMTFIKK